MFSAAEGKALGRYKSMGFTACMAAASYASLTAPVRLWHCDEQRYINRDR